MSKNKHKFPWGIYIGDLIDENETLPVCLPSETGGFCVLFDDDSESIANNFIENVTLKLFEVIPVGEICVDIFDFSHKPRFMHLASLQTEKLYHLAGRANVSNTFNELEKISLHRHHNLLSFKALTLSDYNQNSPVREKYHVVLINLNDYPDDLAFYKRIKEFFDSAYDAGFYCIVFGNQELLEAESKATQYLLSRFPQCPIQNKEVILNNKLFEFAEQASGYDFDYVNDNKDEIVDTLLNALHKDDENSHNEKEFLSIPIGTSTDGQPEINFTLGDKTKAYHAFITGVSGSGKSTLLNTLILGIAQKYTSQDIRLYLMDFKGGVEFQFFKNHPNCEKLFLGIKDLHASITLLEEFTQSINKRAEIFKAKEVKDITAYNTLYPQAPMERLILIVDEVQHLFVGNYQQKDHFSNLLKQLVRQGRAFGVHIILSSQVLAGAQIDKELISQIPLRISYKLTDFRDAETIFTYGNTDALNLNNFELIYNYNSGKIEENKWCRTNRLEAEDIKQKIANILATRDPQLILTPVIVISEIQQEGELSVEASNSTVPLRQDSHAKYDTSEATELLKRLSQEGKIKLLKGAE